MWDLTNDLRTNNIIGSSPDCETTLNPNIYDFQVFIDYYTTHHSHDEEIPIEKKDKKEKKKKEHQYSQLEKKFEADFHRLSADEFIEKYSKKYYSTYLRSLKSALYISEDQEYFTYPDDYQQVFRKWSITEDGRRTVVRYAIGEDRKCKLFKTARQMVCNIPDITLENLVFNLVVEREHYYENADNKITDEVILQTAKNALTSTHTLKPSKHPTFSVNKDFWAEQGLTANQAKQIIRKKLKDEEILNVYDFSKSVKENLETLHTLGIKVGKSKLYSFLKEYKPSDTTE